MIVYKLFIKMHPKQKAQVVGVYPSIDGANRHATFARSRTFAPCLSIQTEWTSLSKHEKDLFNLTILDNFVMENTGPTAA